MVKLGKTIPAGDLFQLDDASSIPVWLQLKNRFIYLITSGFYLPGDQLPTVRGLAAEVEVNYNTVSKVYQSLEEDGYIVSKRRLGAFVADVSDKPGVSAEVTAEIVTAEYLKRCQELGMSLEDIDAQFTAALVAAKATARTPRQVPRARRRGRRRRARGWKRGVTAPPATAPWRSPSSCSPLFARWCSPAPRPSRAVLALRPS